MSIDTVAFVNPAYPNDALIFSRIAEPRRVTGFSCPW
jgi:hypothetical protein